MVTTVHHYQNLHRFAAMGGSYGNVPALKACLQDARSQQCEALMFLGDAIGFCGHSDEVIDLIRQHFDIPIAGNHEQQAAVGSKDCGCGFASPEDERMSNLASERSVVDLSESNRQWLGSLPDAAIVHTAAGHILLCHGSPARTNEFLFESQLDEQRLNQWLDEYQVVGFICTHSGFPWIRHLKDGRFAANCGVVGKPDHDGDPAVHYVILTVEAGLVQDIVIQRVEYDHQDWANTLEREGIDSIFIEPLRTGVWAYGVASLPAREGRVVKQRVMFACRKNSCRSQMAEGFARTLLKEEILFTSAGLEASTVNPTAVQVMSEVGIDISNQISKPLSDLKPEDYDVVISLCDCGFDLPEEWMMRKVFQDWRFDDPEGQPIETFRRVRDKIKRRVESLPLLLHKSLIAR